MSGVNPLVAQVGARVRELRRERGLSLSALAAAAGIGKGSLSELENGVRNPTLATLYALAGPLQVPLATLLAEQPGASVADGGMRVRLLEATRAGDRVREVYALDLDASALRDSPAHSPGVIEHLLVTAGSLEVGRVGESVALAAGGSHTWLSDVAHTYRAGAAGASCVLTIMSGPLT